MRNDSNQWVSISDMMSGLMLVFMFISIGYMIEVEAEKEKIQNIAIAYKKGKVELNRALRREFQGDLHRWNAEILDNNTFRFKAPEMLFESGKSKIRRDFKLILEEFFPRYIKILTDNRFRDGIDEVRIEGHTSSTWTNAESKIERYIYNAKLSQDRAFQVLNYCTNLREMDGKLDWLIKVFRANGLSFAKPIYENGRENRKLSRRVEFRVITKTEDKIYQILEASK
jgi:outer membrane protein OmpA-like peptidoglycan-associated protein